MKLTGIEKATKKAIELAQKKSAAVAVHKFAPEVESVIETVEKKLTDVPEEQKRFFAIKLLEKDEQDPGTDEECSRCIRRDQAAGSCHG